MVSDSLGTVLNELIKLQLHIEMITEKRKHLAACTELLSKSFRSKIGQNELDAVQTKLGGMKDLLDVIKTLSLLVHAYATISSRVWNGYIFDGFQLVSKLGISGPDGNCISGTKEVEQSNSQLVAFRKRAELEIVSIDKEVS